MVSMMKQSLRVTSALAKVPWRDEMCQNLNIIAWFMYAFEAFQSHDTIVLTLFLLAKQRSIDRFDVPRQRSEVRMSAHAMM